MNRKSLLSAAVAAGILSLAPLGPAAARAGLLLDVRVAGSGAKSATVSSAGDVVTMQIIATVTGANGSTADDGFVRTQVSILGTGGIRGNITSAVAASPFDQTSHQDTDGPSFITPVDLDGDGDLDIGNNDNSLANIFRATSDANPSGSSFVVGTLTFAATDLSSNAATAINVRPRVNTTASQWREDGVTKTPSNGGVTEIGAPVLISVGVPEPTGLGAAGAAVVGGLLRRRRGRRPG